MRSILIYDQHPVTRYGLRQILREEFRDVAFAEAGSSAEALRQAARHSWNLAILGLRLPGEDAVSLLAEMCRRHPQLEVLVLGANRDADSAALALHLGASGYISKESSRSQLMHAVEKVIAGKQYSSQAARERLSALRKRAGRPRPKMLSRREDEVKQALLTGKRASEIASELRVSVKTISTYKRRILDKLGVNSIAGLVRYVIDSES